MIAGRLVLGAVFIYAGVPKIFHPGDFAQAVFSYQILPDFLVNFTALTLPWVETIIGALLIIGIWLPGAVMLTNMLLVVFLVAILFNYARGLDVSCGCFSGRDEPIGILTVLRDTGLLLIAGFLLFGTWRLAPGGDSGG